MGALRLPPAWFLLPLVPAAAVLAAVAWWAPIAFFFAAPWLAGVAWVLLRTASPHGPETSGYAELARRRLRRS